MREFPWPAGRRAGCLLTVDVDAVTPMLDEVPAGRAGRHLDEIEQREFGLRIGVPRILAELAAAGLPATFFVPGRVAERSPETVSAILEAGHEIGLHGYRHTTPRNLEPAMLEDDTARAVAALVEAGAPEPVGYRAPEWHMTAELIGHLDRRGLLYDSSLGGYEVPYRIDGLIELPVSWGLDDAPYFLCTSRASSRPPDPALVARHWLGDVEALAARGQLSVLTVHPWMIGRAPALTAFTEICRHLSGRQELWTTTAGALARYAAAQHGLAEVRTGTLTRWWETS